MVRQFEQIRDYLSSSGSRARREWKWKKKSKKTRPNLARFAENGISSQCPNEKGALGEIGMELIDELRQLERYLSTREIMNLFGVRRTTLCQWVRAGRISAIRLGNRYMFDPHNLASWLAARETVRHSARKAA
jgi:excisionase family DNA binding protein